MRDLKSDAGPYRLAGKKLAYYPSERAGRDQNLLNPFVKGVDGCFEFSLHATSRHTFSYEYSCVISSQKGTNGLVFISNTFNIRQKQERFGSERRCTSHGHLIRVDIVYVA